MDGMIADLSVKSGEWIQPRIPAVVLRGNSGWVVESDELKETDLPRVEVGQAVNISVDAYPDLALSGEIESIDLYPVEDDEDVLYNVRIRLQESDPRLRWGMSADISIDE
jgi:multidrug resistance efflux pump